ncbi:hypothetical protein PAXINDRAFT_19590 [Paxillus involutus ATCC 200175]|uniref:Uncharacterized protein n=1 Tax=Paxillus involutus ATCC 200175 TaxID=664439 RepID=A0A0C9TGV7_PAXIN|nr:hypothetical protein PAXINDRAFT_19590 [Paxillus involutus ATCC 200175]
MNIAGPSRASPGRLALRRPSESTHEEVGLLQGLSLDELEDDQIFYDALSDHDIAMNVLLEQAQGLTVFDSALAQRPAAEESTAVNPAAHDVNAAPQPNPNQ